MRLPSSNGQIQVWDRFVRVFHWTLVSCILANYFVIDDGKTVHQCIGYLAVVAVLARIVWGFVGTPYARFASFLPTPHGIRRHLRDLRQGNHVASPGHNPLGALMVFTLLLVVLSLGLTGWMQTLDAFWGDENLQDIHRYIGDILIGLVGIHVTAAVVMGRIERTRLIKAMFTGKQEHW